MTISRRTFLVSGAAAGLVPLAGCQDDDDSSSGSAATIEFTGTALLGLKVQNKSVTARVLLLDPAKYMANLHSHIPVLMVPLEETVWDKAPSPDMTVDMGTQYGIWKLPASISVASDDANAPGSSLSGSLSSKYSGDGSDEEIGRVPNISALADKEDGNGPKKIKAGLSVGQENDVARTQVKLQNARITSSKCAGASRDKWPFDKPGIQHYLAQRIICQVRGNAVISFDAQKTLTLPKGSRAFIGSHPTHYSGPLGAGAPLAHFGTFYSVVDAGDAPLPKTPNIKLIGPVYCPPAAAEEP